MLTRFHKILIGLLVVQIALAVILMTRSDESVALTEKPLLAGFDPAKVTRVQVFAPNQAKPIDLAKRGETWVLASHFDYPVSASKVTDILTPLPKLAAAEPIATQASRHKQLRVGDTEFERKLVISAGGADTTLYVGVSTGARRVPIRIGKDVQVFGVSGLSASSILTEPNQYVDTAYINMAAEDITKLTVQRGTSSIDLERVAAATAGSGSGSAGSGSGSAAPAETWKVLVDGAAPKLAAGESIDTDAINQLVGKVAQLHMMAPADPKRAVANPTAVITIGRKTGTPMVLDVLAEGETSFWLAERGRGRAAMVDKSVIGDVVTVSRDKLVKKPPPKGAGSAAGSGAPFDPSGLPPGVDLPPGLSPPQ